MFNLLKLTPSKRKSTFIINVESDENDGDYLHESLEIPEKEFAEYIPAIKLLKEIDRYPDDLGTLSDEMSDMLSELIPTDSEGQCHSVNLTSIEYVDAEGRYFDVKIK